MRTDVLAQHHVALDRCIAELLVKADGGDAQELGREWSRFEAELLRHFEVEERELLPRLGRERPGEVAALRDEHGVLRADLLALGVRADLHLLRAEAVRSFVDELRAHAQREDELLYRWAAANVDASTWERIGEALADGARAVGTAVSAQGAGSM